MEREITIYDIAKDLGVSATTVSRALNNHPSVSVKTKKKIFDVAQQRGYQSNVFASNLRSKRTKKIGVIVPKLNSSFQSSVLAGMEKVANESGFNLIISQSLESYEKEVANVLTMFNSRVDGLLVSLAEDSCNIEHFSPFLKKGIPLMFYDRISEHTNTTGITIDNVQAAYNATNHLLEQGCKRIAHVLRTTNINIFADRLKGYKYALLENNIPFNPSLVIIADNLEESGAEIVNKIIQMNPIPDGLFVSNDSCAASCIQILKLAGIRIPEDIAVVGFNNEVISRIIEPNLTTINYPGYEMGELAMKNLINYLENPSDGMLQNTKKITLRSELIIRESSKRK